MRIIAIIQARMGSSRLPGKVLENILGKSMLQRVVERVCNAKGIDGVFVATTLEKSDNPIWELCDELGVERYRGSTNDVLDRYYQTACLSNADIIVRITADCPLMDPVIMDQSITAFCEGAFDYLSTAYPEPSFPDGLDVEVMSLAALKKAWEEATKPSDREHVCPYIYKTNPKQFKLGMLKSDVDLSNYRWTVDETSDLEFVRAVYSYLGDRVFLMNDILALLEKHPELCKINFGIERNEGYIASVKEDNLR